jgi:hypothetical protein
MTRTDRPRTATDCSKIVLHRDGDVTLWSCARQQWERGVPGPSELAECSHVNADRITRHTVAA